MRLEDVLMPFIGLAITAVILGMLLFFDSNHDNKVWNDGYCSCGGKWAYVQPIGHAYSTVYMYECDTCGQVKEFNKKR